MDVKLPDAIWTPWAEILCAPCNNNKLVPTRSGARHIPESQSSVPNDRDHVGVCDHCKGQVADQHMIIVPLQSVALATGMSMQQTGGMCSAASKQLGEGLFVWLYDDEMAYVEGEPPKFIVVVQTENEDGEPIEERLVAEALSMDDAIKLIQEQKE